jgi:hypothetical protein
MRQNARLLRELGFNRVSSGLSVSTKPLGVPSVTEEPFGSDMVGTSSSAFTSIVNEGLSVSPLPEISE